MTTRILRLLTPEPPAPPDTDIVTLPAPSRARVERIARAATSLRPLAGVWTTQASIRRGKAELDTLIAEATALRAELDT